MADQKWNAKKYSQDAAFVSNLGSPVVELLAPQKGENILDLGCGDGTLAKKLEDFGCTVTGVDFDQDMIMAAKEKGINAFQQSGEALQFHNQFDAVFSNAALHWMTNYKSVLSGVHKALKSHGRFVAEFGGYGNTQTITEAIETAYSTYTELEPYQSPWFYPKDTEYKLLLEEHGFQVNTIKLIPRPTPLKAGIRGWLKIFANHVLSSMSETDQNHFLDQVEALTKPKLFTEENGWVADYVRLRFSAIKTE